jgi:hypothetical protein
MYECNCTAEQKVGFLKGVHDAGCASYAAHYPEIHIEIRRGITSNPDFPFQCPACGACTDRKNSTTGRFAVHTYDCGGKYEPKPQIQSHHDVWWGSCGL